ncbi:MAG: thiamine biosynthesis protein ThiF [Clostridia bacterium]|nr:thiamine biosynthesis protein ThiF [Clostridia bacterium]
MILKTGEKELIEALKKRHGEELAGTFLESSVAICGLGGLGSNIAIALARSGVGRLILIDFDRVDVSNLHRQQYKTSQVGMLKAEALKENLKEIAPFVKLECYAEKVTEENAARLLEKASIVIEAFDKAEEKAKLVNFALENMPDKIIIGGSGMAGGGSGNLIRVRRIRKNFYLCGDNKTDVGGGERLFAPRVMMCASLMALTALRIIMGEMEE